MMDYLKWIFPENFTSLVMMYALDQRQYADMANGSYYMVTRIMTNAWMWGHNPKKYIKQLTVCCMKIFRERSLAKQQYYKKWI